MSPVRGTLIGTGALLFTLLSACAGSPPPERTSSPSSTGDNIETPASTAPPSRAAGRRTLADLERNTVPVEKQRLDRASPQKAQDSYQKAIELFDDEERRTDSLRQMADLTLSAAQHRSLNAQEDDSSSALPEPPTRSITETPTRTPATPVGTARSAAKPEAPEVSLHMDDEELSTDFESAIVLYERLLQTLKDPTQRADTWYKLAKAYDMAGDIDGTLRALTRLVEDHPFSDYLIEAQFRRGELLFSLNEFDTAEAAYSQVIALGVKTEFYQQSLYKHGWSQYKLGDYDAALESFFKLIDDLQEDDRLKNTASMQYKLMSDTRRVVSLAFANLQGPVSVKNWFAVRGSRDYESDIYTALGELFLHQQRFRDAAETFDTFVQVYPDNPKAPGFSSRHIEAYQQGGFPSLVIPAKVAFIERYGIHGNYWTRHPEMRQTYASALRNHILDLARHQHAIAQQSTQAKDYLAAARWYREYLSTPPADSNQADINHRLAEVLYAAGRYADAVEQFEQTAYSYAGYRGASDAGYMAVVAYQKHANTLAGDTPEVKKTHEAWLRKTISGNLRFASAFSSHEQVPTILRNTIELQIAADDIEGAIATGRLLSGQEPPDELWRFAWRTIANGEFDLGRFNAAEAAYTTLLTSPGHSTADRQRFSEQLAISVYRQAEAKRDRGDKRAAAATFLRVGAVYPQASARKNADYDAAALLLELKAYPEAIEVLEDFRKRYPDDPLSTTIPEKLALAYENSGNFSGAAQELENIASLNAQTEPEVARQALWQSAETWTKAESPGNAIRVYSDYVARHQTPLNFYAEAQYRIITLLQKSGADEQIPQWMQRLVETWQNAGESASGRVTWLGAWAAYELAEKDRTTFAGITIGQPIRQSLQKKAKAMRKALERYELAARAGIPEFVTGANFQMGDMYLSLARAIMDSERPAGLDELEIEQYELLLEEQALPYEDQGIDFMISNTSLTARGVYDAWVQKSYAVLRKMVPGRYAKSEQVEPYVDIIY